LSLVRLAVATLACALVATWLLFRSLEPTDGEYNAAQRVLVGIAGSETRLHNDVLRARGGLLRDYDPLVGDIAELRRGVLSLRTFTNDATTAAIERIATAIDEQEVLVEQFKTENALLQNSLYYFDTLSSRLTGVPGPYDLVVLTGELTSIILHLTRDANPDLVQAAARRLDRLAAHSAPAAQAADITSLVLHGRLLIDALPRIDAMLQRLPQLLTYEARDRLRAIFRARRALAEQQSDRFQWGLYAAALIFLVMLAELGRRLHARTTALQHRSEIERRLAEVSSSFIACEPEAIRSNILHALATLGQAVHSDRAYLLVRGSDPGLLLWQRPGLAPNAGWPDAVVEVLPVLDEAPDDVFATAIYGARPPAAVSALLTKHAIPHWASTKLLHEGKLIGLLTFETTPVRPDWLDGAFDLLRLSGTLMSNALLRETNYYAFVAMTERIQRAKRLESVGLFASGIAHNFNNLLGVMLGHAEIAAEQLDTQSEPARHMHEISGVGERARLLVDQILDYGRQRNAPQCPVPVGRLVRDTAELLRTSLPVMLHVRIDLPPSDVSVLAEPTQLQHALVNIIRNAAQASEAGTPVLIQVCLSAAARPRVLSHGTLPPGEYICIRVVDRGVGIPGDAIPKLFQPFFSTRPAGTGLGLATAAEVIRDSGGAFHVASAPGCGTTIEVWLPVMTGSAPPATPERSSGRGEIVMLVGNDLDDVSRGEDILAALGYEPIGFCSGAAALAALHAAPGRFDAILIEERLPDMTGPDMARAAREAGSAASLVLLRNGLDAGEHSRSDGNLVEAVLKRPMRLADAASVLTRVIPRPL
jgi:signal transduction histidine kinase/CheY-like chemotaxis protein